MSTLQDLVIRVIVRETAGDLATEIGQIRTDSRLVQPGDLFCAQNDVYHDGDAYIGAALEAGAAALVVDKRPPGEVAVPWVMVPNVAAATAAIAAEAAGRPSEKLDLVGVTGTNGKTTTCHILEAILVMAGRRPGLMGTATGARYAGKTVNTGLTTPEAPALQAILADMVSCSVDAAAIEVSSHGVALHRVDACEFAVGVLTGIGRDHLDFHETQEAYSDTKVNWLLGAVHASAFNKGAVVPVDDPAGQEVLSEYRRNILTFGFDEEADIYPSALEFHPTHTRGRISTPEGTLTLNLRLPGRHNVRNALAAIGAAQILGVEPIAIVDGLGRIGGVPGRLEAVPNDRGFTVLVDYAHTPDALQATIASVRELTERRIIVVFGCGGDRDRTKRPEMARVAHAASDVIVVTSDNPRSEDPHAIIEDMLLGIPVDADPHAVHVEEDRAAAIGLAIGLAKEGDLVLIAGKGHETGQTFADGTVAFDDRQVASEALTS